MNSLKTLAVGALSLASIGVASAAPVTINIVASNGDRNPTQNAIAHILATSGTWRYQGVGGSDTGGHLSDPVSTTVSNSNYGTWSGTFGGQEVLIQTNYSGALTGIAAVSGNIQQRFANPSILTFSGSIPNPVTSTNPAEYVTQTADLGFSTNFQSTSPFKGWYGQPPVFYNTLVEEKVGVTPLVFVASPGFPANNITSQQVRSLYQTGYLALSVFTGNPSDQNKFVFAIGRNHDAGQRYIAYLEPGLGVNDYVNVWQPTITGQQTQAGTGYKYGGTVNSQALWPVGTTPGGINSQVEGNGGYTTANDLAPALTVTLGAGAYTLDGNLTVGDGEPVVAGYYIGYVTPNDYLQRIKPFGGVLLKYNGVAYDEDDDGSNLVNVQNGRYTAWIYNRVLRRAGTVTGAATAFTGYTGGGSATALLKGTFYTQLRDKIINVDATRGGGVKIDANFKVERGTDGGAVVPNFY